MAVFGVQSECNKIIWRIGLGRLENCESSDCPRRPESYAPSGRVQGAFFAKGLRSPSSRVRRDAPFLTGMLQLSQPKIKYEYRNPGQRPPGCGLCFNEQGHA